MIARELRLEDEFRFHGENYVFVLTAPDDMNPNLRNIIGVNPVDPRKFVRLGAQVPVELVRHKWTPSRPNPESSRAAEKFSVAVQNLREYYPQLLDPAVVDDLRQKIEVPDTGNDEDDYCVVRDEIERHICGE